MSGAVEGVADVRGVGLAWERRGSGRTVVWGHGLTSSRAAEDQWNVVDHDRLAGSFDLVRYDARGHGVSGLADDLSTYDWPEMGRDQLALASALGVDRYVAAGASLGTATALCAALAEPERAEALVLVIPPTCWATRAEQAGRYGLMADIVDARGPAALIAGLDAAPVPDPLIDDQGRRARSEAGLRAADGTRLATIFRGAAGADLPPAEQISTIAVPTLILAWSGDAGHPVSSAEQLHDLIGGSELHVASTADEFATWTDCIITFVDGLPAAST